MSTLTSDRMRRLLAEASAAYDWVIIDTPPVGILTDAKLLGSMVDAALLVPMMRGGLPLDDPRNVATIEAVQRELAADGYVYRFRHDARPLDQAEGAFLLCGFWMALVEHARGHPVAAAHWFERNRGACGPAALYTEEFDVHQRQLRGNLPQAFVHAGVLECAVTLSPDVQLGGGAV